MPGLSRWSAARSRASWAWTAATAPSRRPLRAIASRAWSDSARTSSAPIRVIRGAMRSNSGLCAAIATKPPAYSRATALIRAAVASPSANSPAGSCAGPPGPGGSSCSPFIAAALRSCDLDAGVLVGARHAVRLRALDDHPRPGGVRRGFAHAAVAAEHGWRLVVQDRARLGHFLDVGAIDRMDDRDLVGVNRGLGQQAMLDVLFDLAAQHVGRGEMFKDRGRDRESVRDKGARNVANDTAQRAVIGGPVSRTADAEQPEDVVPADPHRRHALRIRF